ncbi:MAG: nitroreductase family protein [Acidobacteriota bacterium]|nr:nitroreductase family protein [Acidobacteriota bacterium]
MRELQERWSPVIFSPRVVAQDQLNRLFEAARWAPSSSNEQPWSFVVATAGEPEFKKLAGCLLPGNAWAKQAPVLALSVARLVLSGSAKQNRYAFHDTGMAIGNLLAQATSDGMVVHQMGGFDIECARRELRIPENHDPVAMMAIGYYGDPSSDAALREREGRPRTRKPLDQFVFHGKWGRP